MEKDLDKKLYNDYLNGEKEAFEILYNKYKNKIEYFIYNIVKDYQKAEDIAQETFIYVIQHQMRENSSFKYYIYLVARSKALNYINVEKRRNEIIKLEGKANEHRKILDDYSDELLKQFSDITLTCTVISYAMYTFVAYENAYMMITNIFVVYGLFRYKYLSMKKGEGGSPTETVLTDKSIIIDVILWVITSIIILLYIV